MHCKAQDVLQFQIEVVVQLLLLAEVLAVSVEAVEEVFQASPSTLWVLQYHLEADWELELYPLLQTEFKKDRI